MTLYLLPNLLGPLPNHKEFIPESVDRIMEIVDGLIAESEGEGRRFLKRFKTKKKPHEMPIALSSESPQFLLEPLLAGENWGLISDAGLPCIADPGAKIVKKARELSIPVKAFPGPSSIFLALMQSGLPGQQFIFHGYIPKTPEERVVSLKKWQKMEEYTHIFIEAPYRNLHTIEACLSVLSDKVTLCVASSLTLPDEWIYTNSVANWKKKNKNFYDPISKKPTLFLFSS